MANWDERGSEGARRWLARVLLAMAGSLAWGVVYLLLNPPATSDWLLVMISLVLSAILPTFALVLWQEMKERENVGTAFALVRSTLEGTAERLHRLVLRELERLDEDFRNLLGAGLAKRTLYDKLLYVSELLPSANEAPTAVRRYWATSLDLPSQLWKHRPFFDKQQKLLDSTTDKRRLVVLSSEALQAEIRDESRRENLKAFVEWHEKFHFQLRFLIGPYSEFVDYAQHFVEFEDPLGALADFAVIGDKWIYGEVGRPMAQVGEEGTLKVRQQPRDESNNPEEDVSVEVRTLRLRESGLGTGGEVAAYAEFFDDIWNYWEGQRWPILSGVQVHSECIRAQGRLAGSRDGRLEKQYGIRGDRAQGKQLLDFVCRRISAARKGLVALDIAPMKGTLEDWVHRAEYRGFLKSTLKARARNCPCSRLFILKKPARNWAIAALQYERIFRIQSTAGVHVLLTTLEAANLAALPVHDFIIADELGFSLGWSEEFETSSLTLEGNLENIANFNWYLELWKKLVLSLGESVVLLDNAGRDEAIEYLRTHEKAEELPSPLESDVEEWIRYLL